MNHHRLCNTLLLAAILAFLAGAICTAYCILEALT